MKYPENIVNSWYSINLNETRWLDDVLHTLDFYYIFVLVVVLNTAEFSTAAKYNKFQ